jgi:hypothetical protein
VFFPLLIQLWRELNDLPYIELFERNEVKLLDDNETDQSKKFKIYCEGLIEVKKGIIIFFFKS